MATENIEQKLDKQQSKNLPRPDTIENTIDKIEAGEAAPHTPKLGPETSTPSLVKPLHQRKSFKQLLRTKKFWIITAIVVLLLMIILWFIQPVRIWFVNAIGKRTTVVVTTVAPGEGQQQTAKLKNVKIQTNGQEFKTDQQGKAELINQPYGKTEIKASKKGYADAKADLFLDVDPLFNLFSKASQSSAELKLTAVGLPVTFKAVDWLSGGTVNSGEYIIGDLTVKPTSEGLISFKAPAEDTDTITVRSSFNGAYLDKTFDLSLSAKEPLTVSFVPAGKHYFLSKRDGALGVYGSNLDGSDVQLLIPGTGQESADTAFTVSPNGKLGVLASTRDGIRSEKRLMQQRLYVVDLEKKLLSQVDEANFFELADWSGDKLVYTKATDTARTLRTLEVSSKKTSDIAGNAAYGRSVISFEQIVFVQVQADNPNIFLIKRADLKTGDIKELGSSDAPTIRQTDFDRAAFTINGNRWQEYNFNTGQVRDISQPTASVSQTFLSTASPDGSKRIMLDRIDGKFTIIIKNTADGAEKKLYGAGGLGGPIRWQGTVITFRIANDRETADYVVSINGGEPKKVTDVTATYSTQGSATDINAFRYY